MPQGNSNDQQGTFAKIVTAQLASTPSTWNATAQGGALLTQLPMSGAAVQL